MSGCGRSWWAWRAAKWAAVAVFALIAATWVFCAAAALRLPGGGFKIPLWVPLLAAMILWIRWRTTERVSR